MPWGWMVQNVLTHMASGWYGFSWGWFGLVSHPWAHLYGGLRVVGRARDKLQCLSIFQAFSCTSLANVPLAKASHIAQGLAVRELPKGMGTGRAMILSIFAGKKQTNTRNFFSVLLCLPNQPQWFPTVCVQVSMCSCLSIEESIARSKDLGWGFQIRMNWESIVRHYLSSCFHLQTNVDDFVSVWTKVSASHVQNPLSFFSAFMHTIYCLFLEARKKNVIALYLYAVVNFSTFP